MARATVGGTTNDFVASVGNDGTLRVAAATLTVWTADGVTRLTDLLLNGTQVTQISVPKSGQIPVFSLPDGVSPPVAISANGQAKILIGQAPATSGGSGTTSSTVAIDTDGVPYFNAAGIAGSRTTVLADTDGVPYVSTGA